MLDVFNPELEDLDWISGLDWSEHDSINGRWISKHLHLADAATRLAMSVCSVWPPIPSFLAQASNTPSGPLVSTAEAFATNGAAIHSHHARLSDLMRRHADHLGVGIAESNAIGRDEWEAILSAGALYWSDGDGARTIAAGVAPIIARLAFDGHIQTLSCPLDGGDAEMKDLPRELWSMSGRHAIIRLARCGFNPERPRDPDAPMTHRIFVKRDAFESAVTMTARQHYISIGTGDEVIARDVDAKDVLHREVVSVLRALMTIAHKHWTEDDFHDEVNDRLRQEIGPRPWTRAWQSVTKDPRHPIPFAIRRGPKPKGGGRRG